MVNKFPHVPHYYYAADMLRELVVGHTVKPHGFCGLACLLLLLAYTYMPWGNLILIAAIVYKNSQFTGLRIIFIKATAHRTDSIG